ncbi:ribonuclease E/G [Hirschia baltica]|uniref:Ribonuclease G and E-like protein n=1 Tax=Hirschia baltica (strain ATCC 49814 / DSM 5838 / IFAM 1418) TaxID=582402 RepID=C6XK07_HIRBI|nr:ribonuclease E/G [Hirschia baltica]ACT59452.1 Ribonuclease G and E-like protein [Hirschia baltica ATCC 49814]
MPGPDKLKVSEYVCDHIGLRVRVLADMQGRLVRLHLDPWSTRNKRAELGQIWRGRVLNKEPGARGCLVDIGLKQPTFLQINKTAPPNGALVDVKIKSEARFEKSAVSVLDNRASNIKLQSSDVGFLIEAAEDPFYIGVDVAGVIEGEEAADIALEAIDEALQTKCNLIGGGCIYVEPTRALISVDVDAGNRINKGNRSQFAVETNLLAADAIANKLSLSSLAGLVVIDFLKMTTKEHAIQVPSAFEGALSKYLGRKSQLARLSQFGILEVNIAHTFSPIPHIVASLDNGEWYALRFLRELERQATGSRGAFFLCNVSQRIHRWLQASSIEWSKRLVERIGKRFEIVEDATLEKSEFKIGPQK